MLVLRAFLLFHTINLWMIATSAASQNWGICFSFFIVQQSYPQSQAIKRPEKNIKCVTGNEILQNEVIGTQTSLSTNFGGKLSCIPFFLRASTAATHIVTAPTYTTTIISVEPCAWNAEFQHFILRFNKSSLLCGYHWKRGCGVKERVTLRITLM
jgi:hypothetical protein